ncbi:hypothetical protein BV920_19660 [Pectobacterium odoriferum]|nr:hypothetical protein BV920_19660 [Pectobacterium odoriferum]
MSVLLSRPVQEKLQRDEGHGQISLRQLIYKLESLNASNLEGSPSVRRVTGTTEEIYVMRVSNSLRAFFTKKGKDIILLSIENG